MKNPITRRDFLKLAGLLPLSVAAPKLANLPYLKQQAGKPQNIIIVVFDAFSAYNISLYGYQRETTPNIARWAERAVVYHNHHAGGNFTIPGTASLLTGTFPWTHRAFGLDKKDVKKTFLDKNIFSAFPNHYRIAYTHNPVANQLLTQFTGKMSEYVPRGKLFLANDDFIDTLFEHDEDVASVSWIRAMKRKEEGFAYSLFLAYLFEKQREKIISGLQSQFPRGIPHVATDDYFLLEDAINWLTKTLDTLPKPYMGYFHFMPPHFPYLTHRDFQDRFEGDGLFPEFKPLDVFSKGEDKNYEFVLRKRTNYDEYVLYADREFGRLMENLESSGILDNTWVILTSDHGEMFERGIVGHTTPVLYEPVIKVPLMIFEPGQTNRRDIYVNTSAVDLLPTLLHITGQPPADWGEGTVMPPFAPEPDPGRSLYVVQARQNAQFEPLTVSTIALIKGQYKLMYFFGYDELGGLGQERIELYDLENDPEELNDLYTTKRETAADLLDEIRTKITEVDEPYTSNSYEQPDFIAHKG
jgi:arylsulfatase A-like enzyme